MATLVIWHGYLLGGTGSNVYTANIAPAWRKAGHDVILMCQDGDPAAQPWIDRWQLVRDGQLVDERDFHRDADAAGSCTMVQTDLHGLLPVYLLDRYPGFAEVKRFVDCTDAEVERYELANARAMQWVLDRHEDVRGLLVNHAVMGPPSIRQTLVDAGVPYAVKIHGSELEYAINVQPERFRPPARRALAESAAVLSGSDHIARRVDELLGADVSEGRMHIVPPGVDLERFAPLPAGADRRAALGALADAFAARESDSRGRRSAGGVPEADLAGLAAGGGLVPTLHTLRGSYEERQVEEGVAAHIRGIAPNAPIAAFVGKLIHQKGPQLVLAAWPLVRHRVPDAQLLMVGFGLLREALDVEVRALSSGDMDLVDALVEAGDRLDDGDAQPFAYLQTFFAGLRERGELDAYLAAAHEMEQSITWTGPVDHPILALLWPLCSTSMVPSIAAEAFGMVSAEAAACGCPPLVADHSGLHDVAQVVGAAYPPDLADLVSFSLDAPDPVLELADRLVRLLSLPPEEHALIAVAARAAVAAEWSWDMIAKRIEDLLV